MYGFAMLAFGGLVAMLAMRLLTEASNRDMSRAGSTALLAGLGVGYAYLVDFSMFAAWGFGVRSEVIGTIMTGFMVAGFAWLWEEFTGFMRSYAHRDAGGETKKLRRAA